MVDFDGDGRLDLILSHGESMAQPLSVFRVTQVGSKDSNQISKMHINKSGQRFHALLLPLFSPVCPSPQGAGNNWLRVIPRTRFGAFARGAKVVLFTRLSGAHLRIIDGGSGYLCEMEPVAHFGLGK